MSLGLILTLLAIDPSSAGSSDDRPPIVITGTRLSDSERALRECIERRCPPEKDIDAALAHAENLFVAARYQDSRRIIRQAIGRNDRYARTLPVPVSDLYRASSRVAMHLGEGVAYRSDAFATRRVLEQGLPETDPRHISADLEVANMLTATSELQAARASFDRAAQRAEAIGRSDLAAIARVRKAWLNHLSGHSDSARSMLRRLADDVRPETRLGRLTALVLLARIDRQKGMKPDIDGLLREAGMGAKAPVLVFSPAIDPAKLRIAPPPYGNRKTGSPGVDIYKDMWIDVGYWVTPEGRVSDVEILRQGGPSSWAEPLLGSIAGRIYTRPADGQGSYRIERYTYTGHWDRKITGTRLRVRGEPRIEFLDLTRDPGT